MTRKAHRSESVLFSTRRIGTGLLTCVAIFTLELAFGVIYDSGTFNPERSAQAQQRSERKLIPEGYETDSLAEWHVVLAATNIYTDEIGELKYAENDVDDLVKIFSALGVKDENLIVLKSSNKDPYKTTSKLSIKRNYKRFIDGLNSNSIAFVFLSGHGFTDKQNGGAYYAPLDFVYDYFDETKISIDEMMSQLADSSARFKWLCVDACRNDLAPTVKRRADSKVKSLAIGNVPKGVVLTQSCRSGQFSYEYGGSNAPFNNGLFTRAFVDAISGRSPEADVNPKDGVVTMGEIRDYIEKRVPKDAQNYCSGMQNPVFTVKKGTSFDEIAPYKLFEDLPIMGHHPKDWREGQRLREEAEALLKEQKYDEALKKIQEAIRILPDVPEVTKLKEQIEKLDVGRQAEDLFQKADSARKAGRNQEALRLINEALKLEPKNQSYQMCKELIEIALEKEHQNQAEGEKREKAEQEYASANSNYKSQKYQDALKNINSALALFPNEQKYVRLKSNIEGKLKAETKPTTPTTPPVNVSSPSSDSRKAGDSRTETINGTKVVFHWCPPTGSGGFKMGSPSSEKGHEYDETLHTVVITKGFWLAETETTQALWKAVMGEDNNPSSYKGDDLPVDNVSWNDCQDFIKKLNSKTKEKGLVFRLPSEAHWEYACRAGSETAYWWGSNPEDGKGKENVADASAKKANPGRKCSSFDDGYAYISPVGSFQANAWGLKDMAGNIFEWCEDWYADYPQKTVKDPIGEEVKFLHITRVLRGGSCAEEAQKCRSADRSCMLPSVGLTLGFRLELSEVD